jgi:tocopherol cyclase
LPGTLALSEQRHTRSDVTLTRAAANMAALFPPTSMARCLGAYRRTGADPPFGDPGRYHGAAMEGYYWRIVDAERERVLVVLCGVCEGVRGRWALVALAAHPGGFVRHVIAEPAAGDRRRFGVAAAEVLDGSLEHLRLRLDADHWIDAALRPLLGWPRRAFGALGPAQMLPGLAQYWHPVLLDAEVTGQACVGGRRQRLDGARAYAEKNWGPGFAGRWWWGQAAAFPEPDLGVAFAGGHLPLLGASPAPSAAVVRLGSRVLSFRPPLARARVAARPGRLRLRMGSPGYDLELEGDSAGTAPHVLPVPELGLPRVEMRSHQVLAGHLALRLRRGGRTVIDASSPLAGLELGESPRRGGRRW